MILNSALDEVFDTEIRLLTAHEHKRDSNGRRISQSEKQCTSREQMLTRRLEIYIQFCIMSEAFVARAIVT